MAKYKKDVGIIDGPSNIILVQNNFDASSFTQNVTAQAATHKAMPNAKIENEVFILFFGFFRNTKIPNKTLISEITIKIAVSTTKSIITWRMEQKTIQAEQKTAAFKLYIKKYR